MTASAELQTALKHHQAGRLPETAAICRRILTAEPANATALHLLGVVEHQAGQSELAVDLLRRAVALQPHSGAGHNNLATVLTSLGRIREAEDACRRALAIDPNSAAAHNNLGTILAGQERVAEAIESFARSIAIAPTAHSHFNFGKVLIELGRYDDAMAQFRDAIRLRSDYADAHFAEAYLLLLSGHHMAEGWAKLEWRWRLPGKSSRFPAYPLWTGDPIANRTLLLHAEQGFGDTLQFCRYASLIATDRPVFLAVPRPLLRLLSGLRGVEVIDEAGELPRFDLHCPLLSLPRAFGTTIDTIPAANHYLCADLHQATAWRKRLRDLRGLKVGVVWAGGARLHQPAALAIDRRRSLPFDVFAKMFDTPGLAFVSLQKQEGGKPQQGHSRLHDWTNDLHDFADTAALIDALDLVITVDTAVAHLAGALGKPAWMLNRFDTCWRWMLDRADSPWYPSLKLYRQQTRGDWGNVIARVSTDLAALAKAVP
jgi:Tfp pilus assembly protein PilF